MAADSIAKSRTFKSRSKLRCVDFDKEDNDHANDKNGNHEKKGVMLEMAMVGAGVQVYAVDDRRDAIYATREAPCDYEERYWLCANGEETRGRPVTSSEAYSALRASLVVEGANVVGVDLEGTSSLAVSFFLNVLLITDHFI